MTARLIDGKALAGPMEETALNAVRSQRPPFKGATAILWLGPLIFVLLGLFGIVLYYRRRPAPPR